jgi:hypothetical protein
MSEHQFAIFDTAIGRCGIVWGARGIVSVQLPMGDENKTRTRLHQRHGDIAEAKPSKNVQTAIEGMVELLAGKPTTSPTSCSTSTACPNSTAASTTSRAGFRRARP